MKLLLPICALALAMFWIAVLAVFWTEEPANGHGVAHASVPAMSQGGSGFERHGEILVRTWVLGSIIIAVLVSLLVFAIRTQGLQPARLMAFAFGGLLYELVFGMLCLSYHRSLSATEIEFAGPFPTPTSWMVFGIWLVPAYFIVLYVVCFDRWIMRPEDLQRFERLVVEVRANQSNESSASENVTS